MSKRLRAAILLFGLAFASFPPLARAQLVIGQYEEEAPFRTWNSFGPATASSLGRGGTCFAYASDSSASLSNPALLLLLPKWTATVNGSLHYASFYKYSLVNTGVLRSDGNTALSLYALDFLGASLHLGKWAFALTFGTNEFYDRPPAHAESSDGGTVFYSVGMTQEGILRNLNLSAASSINNWLSAGLGINVSMGNLRRGVVEQWTTADISITDRKTRDFQELYLNGGLLMNLADRVRLAAIFRTPYSRTSKNQSFLEYSAAVGKTDIRIEASSEDKVKQPLILGLGASYKILANLNAALDISYYNWSRYNINYFGETLERNFRDVLKIGAGMEFQSSFNLFGRRADSPIRLGLVYDPQPMKDPRSSYLSFTFGSGISWQNFGLDIGALIGRESGSGNSLEARKISVSLSVQL
jgi:long-subunit fatty acid transport protein